MELNTLKLDVEKQTDGTWIQLDADSSLLIARMHNAKFSKLLQKLSAPHKQRARRGNLDESLANTLLNKVIAKTVLLDWKGLTISGVNLEYSTEAAEKLLNDESFSSFREMVIDFASDEANYREDEIEETVKKSKTSTSGK